MRALKHPWITRKEGAKIPKSFHEEFIRKFELLNLLKTAQKTCLFLSIVNKDLKIDPEYVDLIKNIDLDKVSDKTSDSYPTLKLPADNSEVKFQSSSSDSSNTKGSSNNQGKTPVVNIRISAKKVKVNRSAIAPRKTTGKKSLRIRKSKMRPPNLTKQHTAQNTYIYEKTRKLQSAERTKRKQNHPKISHMNSEEVLRIGDRKDEEINFGYLYTSIMKKTKTDSFTDPLDMQPKNSLKMSYVNPSIRKSSQRREKELEERRPSKSRMLVEERKRVPKSGSKQGKRISNLKKKITQTKSSFMKLTENDAVPKLIMNKANSGPKMLKEREILEYYRNNNKNLSKLKLKGQKTFSQNTPLKTIDNSTQNPSLYNYIKSNDIFKSVFQLGPKKESRNLYGARSKDNEVKCQLSSFQDYI